METLSSGAFHFRADRICSGQQRRCKHGGLQGLVHRAFQYSELYHRGGEATSFSHPFPYSEFEKILYQNDDIPRRLLNTVAREDRIQKRRVLPDEDVREGRKAKR